MPTNFFYIFCHAFLNPCACNHLFCRTCVVNTWLCICRNVNNFQTQSLAKTRSHLAFGQRPRKTPFFSFGFPKSKLCMCASCSVPWWHKVFPERKSKFWGKRGDLKMGNGFFWRRDFSREKVSDTCPRYVLERKLKDLFSTCNRNVSITINFFPQNLEALWNTIGLFGLRLSRFDFYMAISFKKKLYRLQIQIGTKTAYHLNN